MATESHQVQVALMQMLENFQRCGLSRFGFLSPGQLPPHWLDCFTERTGQPKQVVSEANITPPHPLNPHPNRSASTEQTTPASTMATTVSLPSNDLPAHGLPIRGLPKVGVVSEDLPSKGRAAEPWSLPIVATDLLQQRFATLDGQIRACRQCTAIVDYRQQTVFGDGPFRPTVCFMGEAPGADEDRTGKPFVGKAGQLLTKIINAMKLRREDVYILNALKCRPPQNRTPVNEEIDNCRHFVEEQLDTLQPKFIVCLGAVAVRSILQSDLPIGQLRGKFYQYRGARVIVTYHPSYLLRNESAKRLVWDDMKMLMAELLPA